MLALSIRVLTDIDKSDNVLLKEAGLGEVRAGVRLKSAQKRRRVSPSPERMCGYCSLIVIPPTQEDHNKVEQLSHGGYRRYKICPGGPFQGVCSFVMFVACRKVC